MNLNNNLQYFKMCGGLFSFCFLHETVFGNGQIAITHNGIGLGAVAKRQPVRGAIAAKPVLAVRAGLLTNKLK